MIVPVEGSSRPGAQIPMPRILGTSVRSPSRNASMALRTAASPASAFPSDTIGILTCRSISPEASTSPAATFVPPISTPMMSSSLAGPIMRFSSFYRVHRRT
jgi:hypothetical protein